MLIKRYGLVVVSLVVLALVAGCSGSGGGLVDSLNVNFEEPVVNQDTGFAQVRGMIAGWDGGIAEMLHNGEALPLPVDDEGAFDYQLILANGINDVAIRVTTGSGVRTSQHLRINFNPTAEGFDFRVTLVWDGIGDVDLHTWDPDLNHSAYWEKTIATGMLDVDNTESHGPENFTNTSLVNGRFRVAVNAYSGSVGRKAHVRVLVNTGPNAGRMYTFGPYEFTENSFNGGYPIRGNTASWWRPCDVEVSGSTIRVVEADTYPLPIEAGMEPSATRQYLKN